MTLLFHYKNKNKNKNCRSPEFSPSDSTNGSSACHSLACALSKFQTSIHIPQQNNAQLNTISVGVVSSASCIKGLVLQPKKSTDPGP
jgi:hypothetical protein